ncbi:MAG: Uma2 family endonuclease [Cyanobacteria bacterium P01_F01_bin.150]
MQILVEPSRPDIDRFLADLNPNDTTTEFIDGKIHRKQISQGSAIYLQAQLWDEINAATTNSQTAIAYPNHRCSFGGWSIVPDLSVFFSVSPSLSLLPNLQSSGSHVHSPLTPIHNRYPDWIIAISLPEQDGIHTLRTILHCLSHGTQMAWLIDLNNRLTFVFTPQQTPLEVKGNVVLPTPPGFDLNLTVETVLDWIPAKKSET